MHLSIVKINNVLKVLVRTAPQGHFIYPWSFSDYRSTVAFWLKFTAAVIFSVVILIQIQILFKMWIKKICVCVCVYMVTKWLEKSFLF